MIVYTQYHSAHLWQGMHWKLKVYGMMLLRRLFQAEHSAVELPTSKFLSEYWQKTAEGSALRLWLVDIFALTAADVCFEESHGPYPSGFLLLALTKLVQIRDGGSKRIPTLANACKYHDHKETPKCVGK